MFSNALTTIVSFVIVLSVLVFVHELGHFSMAKLFGVRVFEFAIGFPPRLVGWTRGNTMYAINVVPLGGYVRMMGENGADAENPESFGHKPWWQRGLILLGGPMMNIGLAVILFFAAAAWVGIPIVTSTIQTVVHGDPASQAGFKAGDRIVKIDGIRVSPDNIHNAIDSSKRAGHIETIVVRRGSQLVTLTVVPKRDPSTGSGFIGISMGEQNKRYPVGTAFRQSVDNIGQTVMAIPNLISSLSRGHNPGVSGPIGIAHATGQVAMGTRHNGLGDLFAFVALISASLGVFNLLPIPALDGGRLVFVLLSGVRRRSLDPQLEGAIHLAGMAVLLILVALVSWQDVANWVGQ